MKNIYIKHKLPTEHEQWLEDRTKGIGGSDAGAVLGLNPYKSAYTLWAEKTGRKSSDIPDNEHMRLGRDLEDYVAKRFEEATGKKVKRSGYSYQSVEHPFMLANVDRLVVGEDAGLECKTASQLVKTAYDKGDIPASYYAQCMHYMAVTGLKKWYIAILVFNKGFYWYEIERNEKEIQALIEAESDFWKLVQEDKEPVVDASNSTTDTLSELYPSSKKDLSVYLFGMEYDMKMYVDTKRKIKELESVLKRIENSIKNELKDAEMGEDGNYIVKWKTITSNRFDSKRLAEEEPEIYGQYMKQSSYRRFEIKEVRD